MAASRPHTIASAAWTSSRTRASPSSGTVTGWACTSPPRTPALDDGALRRGDSAPAAVLLPAASPPTPPPTVTHAKYSCLPDPCTKQSVTGALPLAPTPLPPDAAAVAVDLSPLSAAAAARVAAATPMQWSGGVREQARREEAAARGNWSASAVKAAPRGKPNTVAMRPTEGVGSNQMGTAGSTAPALAASVSRPGSVDEDAAVGGGQAQEPPASIRSRGSEMVSSGCTSGAVAAGSAPPGRSSASTAGSVRVSSSE